MIRTQIQLTSAQLTVLRQLSNATGRSVADLIRASVDQFLAARSQAITKDERIARAIEIAGMFSSGCSDVSAEHDRYLAEAAGQ